MTSILHYTGEWLSSIKAARAAKTHETYRNGIRSFLIFLADAEGIKPTYSISRLKEKHVGAFAGWLKEKSKSTEAVYLTAVRKFYRYLNAEEVCTFNIEKVDYLVESRSRKSKERAPIFPKAEIERVLDSIAKIPLSPTRTIRLRQLRDIALVLTLADTGLRIHEACLLKRGDLKDSGGSVVIGKGDKQARIFFTRRAKRAIIQYLRERMQLDGATGRPLADLPVFARHDKAVGKRIEPFTPVAGRDAVEKRVREILGEKAGITPHKFRHFFVTGVWQNTRDPKLTQELARHDNIQTTQRYIHLDDTDLEKGYHRAMKDK
jgi:integrase/recombinase XerC